MLSSSSQTGEARKSGKKRWTQEGRTRNKKKRGRLCSPLNKNREESENIYEERGREENREGKTEKGGLLPASSDRREAELNSRCWRKERA